MKRLYAQLTFGLMLALASHNLQAQTYTMSNGTINTCSGTFLDPGGAGNYANGLNVTQTFCSNNGLPIFLQFTQFATEAGFDFVTIYNGPTTGSPVIGTYAGGNNPGTVTASGTCITIRFTTDGSVVAAGWSATIGCGTPPPPPPPPAGSTCANPNSFCGQPITYPAGVNNGTAPAGPAYGCLGSQPNPAWFNMQVSQSGPMNFSLSAGADIDYIIWGPFSGPTVACMAGLTAGNIVSCSYSASSNEFPSVPNAVAGQWYMLLITNFSNQPVTISFNQTGGSGQANCNILCNITNMTGTPGPCNNNVFNVNGTITTTSPPSSGTLTISSSCGGTPLVLNPPFTTSMNYTLTGIPTGSANCTITAAYSADATCTRTVTVVAPPSCNSCTVTANNTGPYCPNGTINLAAGTATVVPTSTLTTTYAWTGPNSYTGSGQNVSIPVATAAMGGVYTVVATTGTTTCTANTTVVINPSPTVTVTSPTVCIGATASMTANGAANYNWSAGATPTDPPTNSMATASPAVTTAYTVTGFSAAGCVGTATSTVTINPLPPVAVTSATICVGDTADLTASNAVSYSWSAGTMPSAGATVEADPAATTTYVVTGTDANGCQATATATVTVNPLPVVTATSTTVCATFPGTITAAGAATYDWSAGTTPSTGPSVSATPLTTTSYTVTGTDANGCIDTAVAMITVNAAPVVSVPSATICINNTTPLTASGASTYTWDPPTGLDATTGTTVNANPTITTTYTVIGTDVNGCQDTTTTTVTVYTLPPIDAGIQDTVCLGNNTILNASGGVSYVWTADPTLTNTSSANPTSTPTVTVTYTVTGTDANGCVNTDDVTVIVPPTFTLTTLAVPANCNGDSNGSVAVSAAPAAGPFASYTYLWQEGSQTQIVSALPAASYSVEVRDLAGCLQTATVTITEPTAVVATPSGMTPVNCNGGSDGTASVTGSGGAPIPPGGTYTYSWAPAGGNAATTTPVAAGIYTVTVTDDHGCSAQANVTITQPTPVTLTPPAPVTICQTQTIPLTATVTGGTSPYTYTWSDGTNTLSGGTVTVGPMTTTTYSITVTDSHNCTATNQPVTVVVTVNPSLTINPVANAEFCLNDFAIKDVSGSGGNGLHNFTWSPMSGVTILNGNGSSVKVAPAVSTVYTVTIHDNCGTPTAMTSFSVTVNPIPVVTITPMDTAGCAPLSVQFTGTSNPPSATCTWNLGGLGTSTNCSPSQTFAQDGTYNISYDVVDVNGCANSTSTSVVVYPIPEPAFTASPQPTTIIDPVISFTDISFGNITNQTWYFHDSIGSTSTLTSPSYTYLTAGTYSVTLHVESDRGCIDSVTQLVYVTDYYSLYVPNAFTPDGDDINEEFRATGTGITGLETTIYDRWGGKIFTTNEMDKGWNGRDNSNNRVAKGVYIYSITATSYLGEKKQYTGHVTVVR